MMHPAFATIASLMILTTVAAAPAAAQPSADQLLSDVGFSAADRQRVLAGELVSQDVTGVSDKDLSISMAFFVKASPADLSAEIIAGDLVTADPQVQTFGKFTANGSLADLAALQISASAAQTLITAQAGESVNLSTNEIAAFNALQGNANPQAAAQGQLQQMLLARYQAYQASGLAGIAPYARGDGDQSNVGGELRKASAALPELNKYLPALQAVLVGYPQATMPGMQQQFFWLNYNIDGTPTYVLTHALSAPDGDGRVIVQRQYYVSAGYNAEQAVVALLPFQQGTLAVYVNHTFTDQVSGFGGAMKRSIGRRMMASKLKAVFEQDRGRVQH